MQIKIFQTILVKIFTLFTLYENRFYLPHAKQDLRSSITNFVYELPGELPCNLKQRIYPKLGKKVRTEPTILDIKF